MIQLFSIVLSVIKEQRDPQHAQPRVLLKQSLNKELLSSSPAPRREDLRLNVPGLPFGRKKWVRGWMRGPCPSCLHSSQPEQLC